MNRDGHNDVEFFVGTEVEHSPAYGLRTLFVVGVHPWETVKQKAFQHRCRHIYFGANQSFEPMLEWETMVLGALHDKRSNRLVTLDFDVSDTEWVLSSGLVEHSNFLPMVSVKMPYINQLGYNATLKIDDKDFDATNPGVWCHSVHSLMDRKVFTDWTEYTQDETL